MHSAYYSLIFFLGSFNIAAMKRDERILPPSPLTTNLLSTKLFKEEAPIFCKHVKKKYTEEPFICVTHLLNEYNRVLNDFLQRGISDDTTFFTDETQKKFIPNPFNQAAFTQEVFTNLFIKLEKGEYPSTMEAEADSIKKCLTKLDLLTNKRKTPFLSLVKLQKIKNNEEKALSAVKDCTETPVLTSQAIYERTDWELSMEGDGSLE